MEALNTAPLTPAMSLSDDQSTKKSDCLKSLSPMFDSSNDCATMLENLTTRVKNREVNYLDAERIHTICLHNFIILASENKSKGVYKLSFHKSGKFELDTSYKLMRAWHDRIAKKTNETVPLFGSEYTNDRKILESWAKLQKSFYQNTLFSFPVRDLVRERVEKALEGLGLLQTLYKDDCSSAKGSIVENSQKLLEETLTHLKNKEKWEYPEEISRLLAILHNPNKYKDISYLSFAFECFGKDLVESNRFRFLKNFLKYVDSSRESLFLACFFYHHKKEYLEMPDLFLERWEQIEKSSSALELSDSLRDIHTNGEFDLMIDVIESLEKAESGRKEKEIQDDLNTSVKVVEKTLTSFLGSVVTSFITKGLSNS